MSVVQGSLSQKGLGSFSQKGLVLDSRCSAKFVGGTLRCYIRGGPVRPNGSRRGAILYWLTPEGVAHGNSTFAPQLSWKA